MFKIKNFEVLGKLLLNRFFPFIGKNTLLYKTIISFFKKNTGAVVMFPIANLLVFLFIVLAGRHIGPVEFGKYILVFSISKFLVIFMTLGVSVSAVKFLAETKDKKIISAALFPVLFFSLVTSLIALFFSSKLAVYFEVTEEMIYYIVVISLLLSVYYILEACARGLLLFKTLSFSKFFEALIFILVIIYLMFYGSLKDYTLLIFSFAAGYFYFIIQFITLFFRNFFLVNFVLFKKLLNYGKFVVLTGIASSITMYLDKIIISTYLGFSVAGLYGAYFFSSFFIISRFSELLLITLFPLIVQYKDKKELFGIFIKVFKLLFIPLFLLTCVLSYTLMFLFGKKYVIDIFLILVFSFYSALFFFVNIQAWFLVSLNKTGIYYAAKLMLGGGFLTALAEILLIPWLGLYGVLIVLIFMNLIYLVFF